MNTPLLLIVWRRSNETKKLIDSLRPIRPQNIYVACDGPKSNDYQSDNQVAEVKNVISREIDWDCKIQKRYSAYNQGCKNGVSNAITWFFSNVTEGIILEDDCLPKKEFFTYCSILLERYRNDKRIWCISGNNDNQNGIKRGNKSYFFSRYPEIWGWATWKRCWDEYDSELSSWGTLRKSNTLRDCFDSYKQYNYWRKIWDKLYFFNEPDTWDYQWLYTCMINSGLSCIPNTQLVENIGFSPLATHTKRPTHMIKVVYNQSNNFLPIEDPSYILRSKEADNYTEENYFSGYTIFSYISIKTKIYYFIRNLKINYLFRKLISEISRNVVNICFTKKRK